MTEYIEREAAVAVCCGQYKECLRKSDMCGDTVAWNICFEIKQLPIADVEPVRHGRWETKIDYDEFWGELDYYECSLCGTRELRDKQSPYCPNCGARMDLEVDE